jgi:23S rRNA (cytosine1962-C5)-methyltransferase
LLQLGSIALKVISRDNTEINIDFWINKIKRAYELRERCNLTDNEHTNCYRLLHAEGDNMPGLIADYYNSVLVLQAHSAGMYYALNEISEAISSVFRNKKISIYNKSSESLMDRVEGVKNEYLIKNGEANNRILENNIQFFVDWETGQKTGFFIDQRENRKLLSAYSKDKNVLNTFCYSGGFSVYALNAGASNVCSVDSSKKAIDLVEKNVELNNKPDYGTHHSVAEDTFTFLKNSNEKFDVIILDPPAYAKNVKSKHNAVQGYKRLNAMAMSKINKNGILFTFSCSQAIDRGLFYNTIVSAALESGRGMRVLHHLSQPPDHPVNIYHSEGEYLKGLVLFIS